MFKKILCGIDTGHRNGYVFKKSVASEYLLSCFISPFFFEINGQKIEGKSGTCIINRKGDSVVHGPISSDTQFANHWIWFDADDGEIEKLSLPLDTLIEVPDCDFFKNSIKTIISEELKNDEYSQKRISDEIFKMLVATKRAYYEKEDAVDSSMEKFHNVRVHIFNRCSEKWTLSRMAKLSGYSVSRFCSVYTTLFGKSPMDDLLDWRFEFAKRLLALKTYRVSEVAEMCGFSSVHYFSRFFTARTGISPKNYK
ncbi:MAG: helix-turn-helix transcriptional regulator [Clostridia bacterium]|nr:helix-turn-helix transcriptional regulator [Clostridia bacterium]